MIGDFRVNRIEGDDDTTYRKLENYDDIQEDET